MIATNFHVIQNASKGYVKTVGAETTYDVIGTVGIDRSNDLALLKVRGANGRALILNSKSEVAIGDQVFAVGNPKGLEGTFSQGIVSSVRRENGYDILQITAPLSPGSSGGPVLDTNGQVIGIAVGSIEGGQSLNFAIPSAYLVSLLSTPKKLINLDSVGRSNATSSSARLGTPPAYSEPKVRPRRAFKQPDQEEANSDYKCSGSVLMIEVSNHKFEERFGKWEITSAWDFERVFFNDEGNIDYEEGSHFKDFMDLASILEGPWEPSRYKRLYTYNYEDQETMSDLYWAPLNEKIFEYRGRDIKKYHAGELIESAWYKRDGSLQGKTVVEKNARGGFTSTWFQSDGEKSSSEVTYNDASGAEVNESQDKRGNVTFRTIKSVSGSTIIREMHNYTGEGVWTRTVRLSNAQNDLEFESTTYLGDRLTERMKTEYAFDGNGNWIRKVTYKEVTKFGRTYFEPQTATLRRISYRSKNSAPRKVRSNRRLLLRSKL